MSASYIGGWLGDRFEPRYAEFKPVTTAILVLCAFPFIFICFFLSRDFSLSIICFAIAYFLAEQWFSPTISMLYTLFPA